MKKIHRLILIFMAFILVLPLLSSCRKGEEDPWFSFYSRKSRLCKDFKVISYKRTEQTNDSIVGYTFNGNSGTYVKITSTHTYISPGTMSISFTKEGSYKWEQTIATDTSDYQYSEQGLWYFTGGSKDTDTKTKELVGLQKTEFTQSFSAAGIISSYSYTGSGDLGTNVFHILELASDEVKLDSEFHATYATLSSGKVTVIKTEITLEPK